MNTLNNIKVLCNAIEISFDFVCAYRIKYSCRTAFGRLNGTFDMRPYQFVIALGVLVFVYMGLCSIYYLLPKNLHGKKYIPGN